MKSKNQSGRRRLVGDDSKYFLEAGVGDDSKSQSGRRRLLVWGMIASTSWRL